MIFSINLNTYQNLDLSNHGIYTHFINNHQILHHHSIVYGIRELNIKEIKDFCLNKTFNENPPIINDSFHFSSNYEIRIYQSGCFYLDLNNNWQSDGLLVSLFHENFI